MRLHVKTIDRHRSFVASSPAAGTAPRAVEFHIEQLVLHRVEPAERLRIGDALQAALASWITKHGWPGFGTRDVSIERIDAGSFRAAPGERAGTIGNRIARCLHQGMSRSAATGAVRPNAQSTAIEADR
jgi:hypothetical protein